MTQHEPPFLNSRYTRRRAIGMAALGAAGLAGLSACGSDSSSSATTAAVTGSVDDFKGEELNIFTWASYHNKPWIA